MKKHVRGPRPKMEDHEVKWYSKLKEAVGQSKIEELLETRMAPESLCTFTSRGIAAIDVRFVCRRVELWSLILKICSFSIGKMSTIEVELPE